MVLLPAVFAQSNTTNPGCGSGPDYLHANMTDAAAIDGPDGGEDWRVTITVADSREKNLTGGEQEVYLWVDVPEAILGSEDTSFCVGMITGDPTNAHRNGSGSGGCAGVLSDDCIAALEAMRSTGDRCPFSQWRRVMDNECSGFETQGSLSGCK